MTSLHPVSAAVARMRGQGSARRVPNPSAALGRLGNVAPGSPRGTRAIREFAPAPVGRYRRPDYPWGQRERRVAVRAKAQFSTSAGRASAETSRRPQGEASVPAEHPPPGQTARVPPSHVDARRAGDRRRPSAQGPSSSVGLIESIRDRATFLRLRRSGRRVRRGPVTVTWVSGEPDDTTRVAYAIGRAVGGAVVRNRVRRRLRAVVGEVQPQMAPGAYLLGAAPEAATIPYRDLRAAVSEAVTAVTQPSGPAARTAR